MSQQRARTTALVAHNAFVHGVLRPYQREWLHQILYNRYVMCLGARQIGKSLTVSYAALCLALGYTDLNEASGAHIPAHDVLIVSKDQRTAQSMIREINRHLDAWENLGIVLRHPTKGSESRIALSNGTYIMAMPGKSRSIQGFHGSVLIDELEASDADPEETLAQAMFVASSQPYFKVCIITNSGPKGGFTDLIQTSDEELWVERRNKFQLTNTSIYDAYPDGLPPHIQDMKALMPHSAWKRFYLNMSVEGAETLLEESEIKACSEKLDIKASHIILAIDPGFVSNPSGVIVAAVGGGQCNILYADHWHKVSMDDQITMIKELMVMYKVTKIIIDAGAQGFQMARTLEAMYPTMTKAVSVSTLSRNRSGATLKRLTHEKNIYIPNKAILIEDLESIIQDDKLNIVIPERPGPNKSKIHGDSADALLMIMEDVSSTYKPSTAPPKMHIPIRRLW